MIVIYIVLWVIMAIIMTGVMIHQDPEEFENNGDAEMLLLANVCVWPIILLCCLSQAIWNHLKRFSKISYGIAGFLDALFKKKEEL